MTTPISDLLRDAMQTRFGGSVSRLAEACDVSVQMASKWVSDRPRYRSTPGPASCEKIAIALGVDPDDVLVLAGHRKARKTDSPEVDVIEQFIRQRTAEMREAVQDTPQEFWATIIRKTFDRAIDGARDMAHLLIEANATPSADNAGPDSANNAPRAGTNEGKSGPRPPLALHQPAFT